LKKEYDMRWFWRKEEGVEEDVAELPEAEEAVEVYVASDPEDEDLDFESDATMDDVVFQSQVPERFT
jgi:hypothetical protein